MKIISDAILISLSNKPACDSFVPKIIFSQIHVRHPNLLYDRPRADPGWKSILSWFEVQN